ncbi:MAG TPA: RusA family crossover junction endodeoxyribonuclease [Thermoanaerobaculia bacterium]|nr:RusA family crossover junction endodeoxyribonuclease [Thermoanaerobaculia bacterium]
MSPRSPELYPENAGATDGPSIMGRIDFVPPTTSHHAKKIVRFQVGGRQITKLGDTDELKAARAIWWLVLLPFKPTEPLEGPLAVTLDLTWPWRKSDSNRTQLLGRIPSEVKPDADNAAKGILDTMARLLFFKGDQQVADLHIRKWIGMRPGLEFSIRKIQFGGERGAVPASGQEVRP